MTPPPDRLAEIEKLIYSMLHNRTSGHIDGCTACDLTYLLTRLRLAEAVCKVVHPISTMAYRQKALKDALTAWQRGKSDV